MFNFLDLGFSLIIQKAYKFKGRALVLGTVKTESILSSMCFGLRYINAENF